MVRTGRIFIAFGLYSASSSLAASPSQYGPYEEGRFYQQSDKITSDGYCALNFPYFYRRDQKVNIIISINKEVSREAPTYVVDKEHKGSASETRYIATTKNNGLVSFTRFLTLNRQSGEIHGSFGGQISSDFVALDNDPAYHDKIQNLVYAKRAFHECIGRDDAIDENRYPPMQGVLRPLSGWQKACSGADLGASCAFSRSYSLTGSPSDENYKVTIIQHSAPEAWKYDVLFAFPERDNIRSISADFLSQQHMEARGCEAGTCSAILPDVGTSVEALQGAGHWFTARFRKVSPRQQGINRPFAFNAMFEADLPLKQIMGPTVMKPQSSEEIQNLTKDAERNSEEQKRIKAQYEEAFAYYKGTNDLYCLTSIAHTIEGAEAHGGGLMAYVYEQAIQNSGLCYAQFLKNAGEP